MMRHAPIPFIALLGLLSCAQGSVLENEDPGGRPSGGQGGEVSGGAGSGSAHGPVGVGGGAASGASSTGVSSASGAGGGAMSGAGGGGTGGAGASGGGEPSGGSGVGGAVGVGGAGSSSSSGVGGAGGGPLGCVIVSEPFTSCPGGFTSGGVKSDWQCGMPSGAQGPPGDHTTGSGSLWGTNITGNANTCEDSELASPTWDLSAFAGKPVTLSFWHWFDFRVCTPNGILCPDFACMLDTSSYSGGVVEVFVNGGWVQVNPIGGYGNGGQTISCAYMDAACTMCGLQGKTGFTAAGMEGVWQKAEIDLSAYAGAMSKIRFRYASHDAYSCYPKTGGWYIDDIEVSSPAPCP